MRNSLAAGRQLAARVVLTQVGATALVAVAFAWRGWSDALGVMAGGTAAVVGTILLAWRLFAGPPVAAGLVLMRLFVGNVLRWCAIGTVLYLAMVKAALPPLPVLAGLMAALLPQMAGLSERRDARHLPILADEHIRTSEQRR